MRYKEDRRTLAFVAIYFALAYTGFFLYQTTSWWVLAPMLVGACIMCFCCAVIVHNTVHSPVFVHKTMNKIFQYVLSVAYGYSVSAFVPGHNFSHHKETQTLRDSMRTTKARFRWNFLNQALFFFLVTTDVLVQEIRWVKKMYREKPTWFYQWLGETLLTNAVRFAALIYDWQAGLIFIWLPHFYAVWGIVGTNIWQHDGTDQSHPYNHSRTFTGPLLNFFTCNNGYHGAHHDRPGLHWSLLPEYHRKHIAPYIHPNLNRVSLFQFLWEHNIYPGKRLDYLGNPIVLPPYEKDEDWIEPLNVKNKQYRMDFGAEEMSIDEALDTTEVHDVHLKKGKEALMS